jgi:NTE family protein
VARPRTRRPAVALALAGGGPFGAVYELGALLALEDSIEGLRLDRLDCYVGVSAGGFLAAALANRIAAPEIYRLFIESGEGEAALTPELFMRPALREYLRRLRVLPPLAARLAWRSLRRPLQASAFESFTALGGAIPTGLFDNEAIHDYLARVFGGRGRSNDFRKLDARLYLVATDLDTGESVSFGRPGHDEVPISKAVQASAALPGLFPPVELGGRHYVDGALRKTLHASEALQDGARLVICVNPLVPFDARLAARKGRGPRSDLVEGGLPAVLSQTFRAVIHSRMAVGLSRYRAQFPRADVLLFQPDADDGEVFFTNPFGYAERRRVCEHAFERTRRDLQARAAELEPCLARHGLGYRWDRVRDAGRTVAMTLPRPPRAPGARAATGELRETLAALRAWAEGEGTPQRA